MNNTELINATGLAIQIAIFLGFIVYLAKVNINESSSFIKFPPFIVLSLLSLECIIFYSLIEFDRIILDPSDAYDAIKRHGFIEIILKVFIAGAAICIAWHRSLITGRQIDIQIESNNISNFYDIRSHFMSLLPEGENKISSIKHINNQKNILFISLFKNPQKNIYSINDKFKSCFENILNQFQYAQIAFNNMEEDASDNLLDSISIELNNIGISFDTTNLSNDVGYIRNLYFLHQVFSYVENIIYSLPIDDKYRSEITKIRDDFFKKQNS